MEATTAASGLSARLRAHNFERECERLRPLGEAYVVRRFHGQLGRADAEDAVAEVLLRLHRQDAGGRSPQNLRAAFFTAVRHAAIDILRTRAVKPTVALEAAADAPAPAATPAERAESREDAVRLREALARMRGNYREAILLRFGLGLTVPEIAQQMGISVPAAKKLMLRAARQARVRLTEIESKEFCPEMREMARRSLFEKEASGLASVSESEILRTHFAHCGSCRSFLASLHERLHDLGAAALLGLGASQPLDGHLSVLDRLSHWLGGAADGAGAERARHLALRAAAPLQSGDGAAGVLVGSGQKIAAICGAGAAATATCLLTGAVGPGIGATPPPAHAEHRSPAKVRRLSAEAPQSTLPVSSAPSSPSPAPAAEVETTPGSTPSTQPSSPSSPSPPTPAPAPQSTASSPPPEFGIESGSSSSSASSSPSPSSGSATSTAESGGGEFAPEGSSSARSGASSSGSSTGGSVGFHG